MSGAGSVPEGFSVKMAVVDSIPVLTFCAGMAVIGRRFRKPLFLLGAVLCALAGCGKVAWKLLIACKKKNVLWLAKQFRYTISAGFGFVLASVFKNRKEIDFKRLLRRIVRLPAGIFFGLAVLLFGALSVMGAKLDKTNAKHNWIEQFTNIGAQSMLLLGVLFSE